MKWCRFFVFQMTEQFVVYVYIHISTQIYLLNLNKRRGGLGYVNLNRVNQIDVVVLFYTFNLQFAQQFELVKF